MRACRSACARRSPPRAAGVPGRRRARRGCRSTSRSTRRRDLRRHARVSPRACTAARAPRPGPRGLRHEQGQRRGRVFVDWSQNDHHKTTVNVYSLRRSSGRRSRRPLSSDEVEGLPATGSGRRSRRTSAGPCAVLGDLFAPVQPRARTAALSRPARARRGAIDVPVTRLASPNVAPSPLAAAPGRMRVDRAPAVAVREHQRRPSGA